MPPEGRRVLLLSNFFTQGHGGTPESVLLLAREIAAYGIATDVFCGMGLLRDAHNREALPAANDNALFSTGAPDVRRYSGLFVAGSWNRRAPLVALRAALHGIPVSYAAKGCLCAVEFSRLRDMRRVPYFLAIEWILFALARKVVFSSLAEKRASVLPEWVWRRRAVILPEPFRGEGRGSGVPASDMLTVGFLAEISPRKGLHELIAGLGRHLATRPDLKIRLKIGGEVRRGSEAYFENCKDLAIRNGSAAHIEWHGPVRGGDRKDFYRSLDMFFCPSGFESFGLTPLEALWQGRPVCVAPSIGLLEHLSRDAPVLRLPDLSEASVAAAIAETAQNIEIWRSKGHAWEGRHALTRSNAEIAGDFARILLDQKPV